MAPMAIEILALTRSSGRDSEDDTWLIPLLTSASQSRRNAGSNRRERKYDGLFWELDGSSTEHASLRLVFDKPVSCDAF